MNELANSGNGLPTVDLWPVELLSRDASPESVREREQYWLNELQSGVPAGHNGVHVHIQHGTIDNESWARIGEEARFNHAHGITFAPNYDGLPKFGDTPYIF